jgi:leucyl-tRNA synthetase
MLVSDTFELVCQVNGKIRDRVSVAVGASDDQLLAAARACENIATHLDGVEVVKEVVVPGRLVNFVVRPS